MILDEIVEKKKIRLAEHKARIPETEMRRLSAVRCREAADSLSPPATRCREAADSLSPSATRSVVSPAGTSPSHPRTTFYSNLKKPGLSIIGEFKKASPSLGQITEKIDLMERIEEYNASVDAISCLTEEDYFHGNVDYLKQIRAKSDLPILRKDFMIDEYQFYEAKVIGADAVLLITAILDDARMRDFYALARELELDVLVETHDEWEIERAMKINPRIIGVNNRNLKDFSITLETTRRLRPYVPKDKVFVAESGIMGDEDVRFLHDCGVDAFLIGRAFMEAENPRALASRWRNLNEN